MASSWNLRIVFLQREHATKTRHRSATGDRAGLCEWPWFETRAIFQPMTRTILVLAAGCSLLLTGCRTQGLQGNAKAGQQLFQELKCATCHSVNGVGGRTAPALGGASYTPNVMAASMWSHVTKMWQAMEQAGIQRPKLTEQQAGSLYAFFAGTEKTDKEGDHQQGRQVYQAKLCESCHDAEYTSAPKLGAAMGNVSPFFMVSALWAHGDGMLSRMVSKNLQWQQLSADEMGDLIAYLKSKK
jgi:cytochrome c2